MLLLPAAEAQAAGDAWGEATLQWAARDAAASLAALASAPPPRLPTDIEALCAAVAAVDLLRHCSTANAGLLTGIPSIVALFDDTVLVSRPCAMLWCHIFVDALTMICPTHRNQYFFCRAVQASSSTWQSWRPAPRRQQRHWGSPSWRWRCCTSASALREAALAAAGAPRRAAQQRCSLAARLRRRDSSGWQRPRSCRCTANAAASG